MKIKPHITNKNENGKRRRGEGGTVLITLLIFMATGLIVLGSAVSITVINTQGTSKFAMGEETLHTAETGAENAILRLLRNRTYSGETLTVGDGTATITVSGSTTKTIISEGVKGGFRRKIQVVGTLSNNVFTITSWKEID